MIRRMLSLLLALLLISSLAACGGTASSGDDGEKTPGSAQEDIPKEEAQPEPYNIYDPTVMPEGGTRDGVTYAAYDGIVEHLFFHPVVAYPELAFDGDSEANGIDDYMVTADEYRKILQSVYDRGYILVDIADVWSEVTGEDGTAKMVRNTLYLPEGKKPLILSFDDTNYYEYMLSNGFTWKLIIGEDGKIASWGKDPQGNEVVSRDRHPHPGQVRGGASGLLSFRRQGLPEPHRLRGHPGLPHPDGHQELDAGPGRKPSEGAGSRQAHHRRAQAYRLDLRQPYLGPYPPGGQQEHGGHPGRYPALV